MNEPATVGVAMTTRNRSKTLGIALRHFSEFKHIRDARFWLIDDASDNRHRLTNEALARQFGWNYLRLEERHGVGRAKNAALAQVRDCEWIILVEDDCWPIKSGWDQYLIDATRANDCLSLNAAHANGMADAHIVQMFGHVDFPLLEVANSTGYLMIFHRDALKELGGFDSRMGICGGEDTQMNIRCAAAGFRPRPYVGPANIGEYFYSVDLDWVWGKQKRRPKFGRIEDCEGSALTGSEKAKGWAAGAQFVHDPNIYQEPII